MAFDTNWDLNKYRYHYELPHHWDLKKKFILFHKERFPEDRLVCLAQIFCNVHYLGCRYGEEVMELIDELTKGLIERNEKFDSKSFALASDAVEAKVKAFTGQTPQTSTVRRTTEPIAFVRASEPDRGTASTSQVVVDLTDSPPARKRMGDSSVNGNSAKATKFYHDENPSQNSREQNQRSYQQNHPYNQPQYSVQFSQEPNEHYRQQFNHPQNQRFYQQGNQQRQNQSQQPQNKLYSFEGRRATALVKEVVESGPFGKVVVFRNSQQDDGVINIIERAATAAHMIPNFTFTPNSDNGRETTYSCKFCLDGMYVADGEGRNQRAAKEAACKLALERLRETSFTIEVSNRLCAYLPFKIER